MSESKSQVTGTIIAAIVTGVFTVIAGLVTYWFTSKEPALTYSVSSGPTITGPTSSKRIYVIEIRNTGKKEVSQTLAEIRLNSSQFDEITTESSPGVNLAEQRETDNYTISADFLNPNEYIKVSLLLSAQSSASEPVVAVRAPGVTATLLSPSMQTNFGTQDLFVLGAAVLGAVTSVLSLNPILRRIRKSKIVTMLQTNGLDGNEVLAYICASCGLDVESEQLRFTNSELSYRGTSDYFLFRAMKLDLPNRTRHLVALKAMLLVERISPHSKLAIKRTIKLLDPDKYDEASLDALVRIAIDEGQEPVRLRDEIDKLVRAELSSALK